MLALVATALTLPGCGGSSTPESTASENAPSTALTQFSVNTCTERTTTNYEGEEVTYCAEDYPTDFQEGQNAPDNADNADASSDAPHGIDIGAGVALLDQDWTRRVIDELYQSFGGGLAGEQFKTSWFDYIEAVGVSEYDGKATVRTSLYDDADAAGPAQLICGAAIASGAAGGARVTDANGTTLDECP